MRCNTTSGSLDSLPVTIEKTGTPRALNRLAACVGESPTFQSPSEINTTPRRFS